MSGPSAPRTAPGAGGASITPRELEELRRGTTGVVVVDLRPSAERALGSLSGSLGIPFGELPERFGEIPKGRPVAVHDRSGESASRAAEFLTGHGIGPVRVLSGGLDAYAREVDPSVGRYGAGGDGMFVAPLPRSETGCLAYLLGDPVERRAILVDPGIDTDPYLARLRAADWRLEAIVETHTHADHLAGHAALHRRTDAPIYLGRRSPAQYPHRTVADGEELRAGDLSLVVLETPGHTVDHLTLRLGERIFTGDSLLIGACGRTDLPGGDPQTLFTTFRERYDPLPDSTEVYPAHFGPRHALPESFVSTLGFERGTNEALRIPDREGFVRYMTEGWPPKPADFDRIVAANLADTPGAD